MLALCYQEKNVPLSAYVANPYVPTQQLVRLWQHKHEKDCNCPKKLMVNFREKIIQKGNAMCHNKQFHKTMADIQKKRIVIAEPLTKSSE